MLLRELYNTLMEVEYGGTVVRFEDDHSYTDFSGKKIDVKKGERGSIISLKSPEGRDFLEKNKLERYGITDHEFLVKTDSGIVIVNKRKLSMKLNGR